MKASRAPIRRLVSARTVTATDLGFAPVLRLDLEKLGKRNGYTGKIEKEAATQTEISSPPVQRGVTPVFIQCDCKEGCHFWLPRFPADYSVPKH